jgi:hypothetical protein
MWNGVNYLLKMSSDLDFLDDSRTVRFWLGFPVFRNPFVVPLPLEQLPVSEQPGGGRGPNLSSFTSRDFNSIGAGPSTPAKTDLFIRLKRREVDVDRMLSAIGDLDMMRVREAEKAILAEEASQMRSVRHLPASHAWRARHGSWSL